jgi:transcriptional regulatory protein LevR
MRTAAGSQVCLKLKQKVEDRIANYFEILIPRLNTKSCTLFIHKLQHNLDIKTLFESDSA